VTPSFLCRCNTRVNFIAPPPPFAFRRLTQELSVATTVSLFESSHSPAAAADACVSHCDLLAQVLIAAGASALLPNFVAAEFNDNDGGRIFFCDSFCVFN
jgi:hypothetical protein